MTEAEAAGGDARRARRRGPGRPRQVDKRRGGTAREQILAESARLFSRRGFAGTTMSDIAEAVGVRTPALYYHFTDKEAVLRALADLSLDQALDVAARALELDAPAPARLHRLLRREVEALCSGPYELAFLFDPAFRGPAFRSTSEKLQAWQRAVSQLIREGMEQGAFDPGDPRVARIAIVGIVESAVRRLRGGEDDPGAVAGAVADFALRAILRDPATLERWRSGAADPGAADPGETG